MHAIFFPGERSEEICKKSEASHKETKKAARGGKAHAGKGI